VPSVCNAADLLILLKLFPFFTFLQQLMTKKIVSYLHIHLFSNVLHRRRRVSPRRPMYLLIVGSHYCVVCFAYALHMHQQNLVPFPCLYIQWCPPTWVWKAPNKPSVLQTVLVKIVNEILLWQCAFGGSWNNHLGSRSQTSVLRKDRDLDHIYAQERGQKVGTGAASWRRWMGRHCWNIIIQASTSPGQHHVSIIGPLKYFERGGFTGTTATKERSR